MKIEDENGGLVKMVVLREGEAEKTKRFARHAREIENFRKIV